MLNSLAVVSLIVSVAVAQQTPLIPSGLGSKCSEFLNTLNQDTSLSPCIGSLISATSAFTPGGTASAASVSSALTNVCTESTECSEPAVRKALAQFSLSCSAELNSNAPLAKDLILLYDYLYAFIPTRDGLCSKNDDGAWCATTGSGNVDADSKSSVENYLVDKAKSSVNGTTFSSANVAFGFLQPSLSTEALCTTCTRSKFRAFLKFIANTPHAVGLEKSALLTGFKPLLASVDSKCGPDFLEGAVQAAGAISDGFGSGNAAVSSSPFNAKIAVLAVFSVAAMVIL